MIAIASRLKSIRSKSEVEYLAKEIISEHIPLTDLLDCCFSSDRLLAFHSAWVLENVFFTNPQYFYPYTSVFLSQFARATNASVQRHFAKILSEMLALRRKGVPLFSIQSFFGTLAAETLVEACFDWLICSSTKVAVKAHCLDCLYYLASDYEWIKNELIAVAENLQLMSPAMNVRIRSLHLRIQKYGW